MFNLPYFRALMSFILFKGARILYELLFLLLLMLLLLLLFLTEHSKGL